MSSTDRCRFNHGRRRAYPLLFIVLTVALVACTDGECVPFEGRAYNWNLVPKVSFGMTDMDIRGILGAPVAITKVSSNVQDWRFFYRCRKTSWIGIGSLRVASGGATAHSEAVIRLKLGRVQKIIKDDPWVYE